MNIEIWSIGKENDAYINEGVQQYLQKTKPWISVDLHIIPLPKRSANTEPAVAKQQEEELLLKKLKPYHYLILLDERGKMLSSTQWATQFQQCMNMGTKTVVLLIGGAYGVTDSIRQKANQCWSLSNLVFPHQLVRLLLAEQVYRAYSILNHSPYHHV